MGQLMQKLIMMTNKGRPHKEETKLKISRAMRGVPKSSQAKENMSLAQKNRTKKPFSYCKICSVKLSKRISIHCRKCSQNLEKTKWEKISNHCIDCPKRILSKAKRCRKHNDIFNCGENNPAWRGGVTTLNMRIRKSAAIEKWRIAVFQRDDYTCTWCGKRGGKLNADHIKPFSIYPELRTELSNGRTLCVTCHRKTDSWAGKGIKRAPYKTKLKRNNGGLVQSVLVNAP